MTKGLELKKAVGKWQFVWVFGQNFQQYDELRRIAQIGFLKITKLPQEGTRLRRRDYKGFLIVIHYRLPVAIERNWP